MKTVFLSRPMRLRFMRASARASAIVFVFLLLTGFFTHRSGSATQAAQPEATLIPAVVYVRSNGHIHEIALKGTWQDRDLTLAASAPVANAFNMQPMAFRRNDGVLMIVYRGADFDVNTIYLEIKQVGSAWQEIWHRADLSYITGAPTAHSDPFGYVRSDGISTVIYCGSDGDIHELRLEGTWIHANLTDIAGNPSCLSSPVAYIRGDNVNAIVYKNSLNDHIIELYLDYTWKWNDRTPITSGFPIPLGDLSAYTRSDGISTILYTGHDHHIYELRLDNGWELADLTYISGAPDALERPYGYVRNNINAIVYATTGTEPGRIVEIWLSDTWHYDELTLAPNAGRGYKPIGYVRADGIPAVVYAGAPDWHVQELRLQSGWHWTDLSSASGLSANFPWPYNRYAVYYGVTVTPETAAKSGIPEATVIYPLEVKNTGNLADTFDVVLYSYTWPTNAPASVGPIAPGSSQSVNVSVTVPTYALSGSKDIATINITSRGDNTKKDSAVLTTTAKTAYGVLVVPSFDYKSGNPGATLNYTLQVYNTGNIADTFNVAVSGNAWTTSAPASVGPIPAFSNQALNVSVTIPASVASGSSDSATITLASQHDNTKSSSATLTTTASMLNSDLEASLSAAPNPVTIGNNLTYTIVVSNHGPADATHVVLTNLLPAGVTYVSNDSGCTRAGSQVTCNLGSLANGLNKTVHIVVRATATGSLTDTASVTGDQADPSPANNSDSTTTLVYRKTYLPMIRK